MSQRIHQSVTLIPVAKLAAYELPSFYANHNATPDVDNQAIFSELFQIIFS